MRRYRITKTENGVDTLVSSVPGTTALKVYHNLFRSIKKRADREWGVRLEETQNSFSFHYPKSDKLPNGYTVTLKIEEE